MPSHDRDHASPAHRNEAPAPDRGDAPSAARNDTTRAPLGAPRWISTTGRRAPRLGRWKLPDVVTAVVALVVWRIFFPALMSQDSIVQYTQALDGRYDDWHPPLMAIVLHYVFSAGGAIGILMLAQCLAGVFGVRALAAEVIRTLFGDRVAPARVAWLSLAVLLLLLLPLSPLAFYLMTFWKDAWAAVVMLWLGALTLRLGRETFSARRLVVAIVLGAVLAMLRHNAAVALPFVGIALALTLPPPRRWRGLAVAVAPLVLFLAGNVALERAFDVQKGRVDSAIMVLDLVGLCNEGPAVCRELPWTQSHVRDPKALAEYRPGDMGVVFWRPTPPVDLSMRTNYPRLRAEYLFAVRRFPLLLAKQKVQGFVSLLGLRRTFYFFHGSIVDNPHRLALNGRFAGPRDWLILKTGNVALQRWRWIAGVHAVWLAIDVIALVALLAIGWLRRRRELVALGLVLLLPLGYYLSYLLAAPVEDFRFMYPSTLFVQSATLAALLAGASLLQKPIGRLPYFRRLSANAGTGS